MDSLFLATAIMGFVEFVKAVNANDRQNAELILGATVIGALSGFFEVDHLTVITGIQAGLSAAGIYKMSKMVGGA